MTYPTSLRMEFVRKHKDYVFKIRDNCLSGDLAKLPKCNGFLTCTTAVSGACLQLDYSSIQNKLNAIYMRHLRVFATVNYDCPTW